MIESFVSIKLPRHFIIFPLCSNHKTRCHCMSFYLEALHDDIYQKFFELENVCIYMNSRNHAILNRINSRLFSFSGDIVLLASGSQREATFLVDSSYMPKIPYIANCCSVHPWRTTSRQLRVDVRALKMLAVVRIRFFIDHQQNFPSQVE